MPETMETEPRCGCIVLADDDIGGHVIFPFSQQPLLRFERCFQF